jgi:hypothetical protein
MTELVTPGVIYYTSPGSISDRKTSQPIQESSKRLDPKNESARRIVLHNTLIVSIRSRYSRGKETKSEGKGQNQKTRLWALEDAVAKIFEGIRQRCPSVWNLYSLRILSMIILTAGSQLRWNCHRRTLEKADLSYPPLDLELTTWPADRI